MTKVSFLFLSVTFVAWAAAMPPIFFESCSKITCQSLKTPIPHSASSATVKGITFIADSPECPGKCSIVAFQGGEAVVMGNFLDIVCRVYGGNLCEWTEKKGVSKEDIFRKLKDLTR